MFECKSLGSIIVFAYKSDMLQAYERAIAIMLNAMQFLTVHRHCKQLMKDELISMS